MSNGKGVNSSPQGLTKIRYFLALDSFGTPGGTRTPNRLVRTELLYPLSYGSS